MSTINLTFLPLLLAVANAVTRDVVLLAGQSNMCGFPNMAGQHWSKNNGSAAGQSLETLQVILTQSPSEERYDELVNEILKAESSDQSRAELEADELLSYEAGIWETIFDPIEGVYCSNQIPPAMTPNTPVTTLQPGVNCGYSYGPELMLGKTITTLTDSFALPKVCRVNTAISEWQYPDGEYWPSLQDAIVDLDSYHPDCVTGGECQYKAFVWFQGENDCVGGLADDYGDQVTSFLAKVREQMFEAGSAYAKEKDIPIVVVQIGEAFESIEDYGPKVAAAQKAYCDGDNRAALVTTDNLSSFYHFDGASYLIIGERIARALDGLLRGK